MKKACILGLVLLVGIAALSAQGLTVGPKVSLGSSSNRGDDWDTLLTLGGAENGFTLAYSAGIFTILEITPIIGLQVDLTYSKLAYKFEDSTDWVKFSYNAISFPVYGRFSFDIGSLKPYILAGLDMNLLFGDVKGEDSTGANVTSPVEDNVDKTFLFGFAAGGGVSLPVGPGSLDLGLRYRTNINEMTTDVEMFNQSLNIDIAYGFKVR